jgi:hypothetical protein
MRIAIATFLFSLFISFGCFAQKGSGFLPGYYYDINGQKVSGLINRYPAGKGIEKNEGFIEFKDSETARPQRLSASMIHGFVIARDSFVIAHAPQNGGVWTKNELDFVKVVIDGTTKLYMVSGGSAGGGGIGGSGIRPSIGTGIGTGGLGLGGGIGITIGGGNRSNGGSEYTAYYYGENTTTMEPLNKGTFVEVMTDVMGDEPDVVEKIRSGIFNINNVDGCIKYYNTMEAAHKKTGN